MSEITEKFGLNHMLSQKDEKIFVMMQCITCKGTGRWTVIGDHFFHSGNCDVCKGKGKVPCEIVKESELEN